MKLVFSNYDDRRNPWYGGGGAIAVHQIAKRLATTHQVTIITGRYPGSRDEWVDGVFYHRIGIAGGGGKLGQLVYQASLPLTVLRTDFDLWLESFTPPFSTNAVQLLTQKPVIGLVHMLAGQDMERKYKLPFTVVERWGLTTYRFMIVPSAHIRDRVLASHTNADVEVIPNGVELTDPTDHERQPTVLFLGRIEVDQKGLDLLLSAFVQVTSTVSSRLYIAGTGEPSQLRKLHQLIETLGLTDRVSLFGSVTDATKQMLLSRVSCVVVPSRFETFSLTALEAIAAGTPVVCFDIDGLSWLPAMGGIKVPPFDTDTLAGAMTQMLIDSHLRQMYGIRGRQYAAAYTWDAIADRYEAYIQRVLALSRGTYAGLDPYHSE